MKTPCRSLHGPISLASLLFLSGWLFGSTALAQPRGEAKRENMDGSGKIAQVGPGLLAVVSDGGDKWAVKVQTKPEDFSIAGKADRSFLRPGLMLEFTAVVNKKGQIAAPITSLTIFTPRMGYNIGIGPVNAGGGAGGAAGALFAAEKEEEKPKKPVKTKPAAEEAMEYRIAGEITKIGRKGELTLNAGGLVIKGEVAENAKITLDVVDLSYVSAGDKVEFSGWYYPPAKDQIIANKVSITAAQTFTDAKKSKAKAAPKGDEKSEGDAKADKAAEELEKAGKGSNKPAKDAEKAKE